jgi:deoxyxylulose-5-phosphate synthase
MELDGVETLVVGVPDKFVPHGSQDVLRKVLGLDADGLYFRFRRFFAAGAERRRTTSGTGGGAAGASRPAAG